ncbi:LysM peptidoglycan-binding domain-containing protein [Oligoflexia bacterium]|nr:LysM peptidoglycan-binding domain-containing protein [Oligoflexia bacterium]
MTRFAIFFVLGACSLFDAVAQTQSIPFRSPAQIRRNPVFAVPAKLRPRVDFWIDIFTKYGKNVSVVHHRDFPQAVFKVVDFSKEAEKYSPVAFERYRKKRVKTHIAEVKKAMQHLGSGKAPGTVLQKRVQNEMAFMGPGSTKYRTAVKGGLIRAQTGIKEKYIEAIRRSGRYMHVIEDIFVREHGLPVELTRLPFVESSFDYKAYSSAGAAGIWQFMRRTGKLYLRINNLVDERRDIISSTRAAAKYLKYGYSKLKSWPLALTSYNHGIAGVSKKVKKFGSSDLVKIVEHPTKRVFGFASTNFYPEFLAALDVYDHPRKYFPSVTPEPPMRLAQRKLTTSISASSVSRQLGADIKTLQSVNYAVASKVWKGYYNIPKGYTLKVPAKYGTKLAALRMPKLGAAKVSVGTSSVYGGVVYKVRRGDTLSRIAKKYKTSVSRLRSYNGLRSDLVKVGQLLVVKPKQATTGQTTAYSMIGTENYKVRRGDTLSTIAKRHRTSISKLRELNHLRSTRIWVGQVLKVSAAKAPKPVSPQPVKRSTSASSHKVRRGDTLISIAKKYGTSVTALRSANRLSSSKIKIGQTLQLSAATRPKAKSTAPVLLNEKYKVRRGESLWSISKRFGVSVQKLKDKNNMRGSRLRVGQTLVIP